MIKRLVGSCLVLVCVLIAKTASADTAPNPLESAYWRFGEGTNGGSVNFAVPNPVLDSINQNHLDAFNADTAPMYTNVVPPTPLKSGLPNTLALDFSPHQGGGDDLYTNFNNKHINNGIIASGGGFTIEAAFKTDNPASYAAIISKEGRPGGSRPQQTLELKTRADNSLLQIEMWDGNANLTQISSLQPINTSQWYYVAVVNNGSTMSMYLDANNGQGYQLQGSVPVTGALYQAVLPSWDNSWTVGRGQYAGHPADWFDGIIDEVRLSNTALSPSNFLFAPASTPLAGDYNNNGKVDAADYVLWRNGGPLANETATPGSATAEDYTVWRSNFGNSGSGAGLGSSAAVPEPSAFVGLCLLATAGGLMRRRAKTTSILLRRLPTAGARVVAFVGVILALAAGNVQADTASNPLESAYWRFEEGPSFDPVDYSVTDPIKDSLNQNHLDAFDVNTAPTYTTEVPPTALKSGQPNTLALDFIPNPSGGGDDLFTLYSNGDLGKGSAKHINNGIIAPGGGFTVEGAFKSNNPARYAAIVGKEGQPAGSRPVQTFVIKTRGDNSKLQVELYDGSGTERQVSSTNALSASTWYYFAAVNNGSTLSLYLNSNNGQGYQLQGSVNLTGGALFQGVPTNPLWDASWTVGRGQYAGNPADWFDGIIDEVRISNTALTPSNFLFAPAGAGAAVVPEPATVMLAVWAMMFGCGRRRPR